MTKNKFFQGWSQFVKKKNLLHVLSGKYSKRSDFRLKRNYLYVRIAHKKIIEACSRKSVKPMLKEIVIVILEN